MRTVGSPSLDGAPLDVTMVCARFAPFVGGTEAHVCELGGRLTARGHAVTVITTVLDPSHVGISTERGMRIERVLAYPRRRDFYFAPALRSRVRRLDTDLLHVQGYHTLVAPMAMSAAIHGDLPFVVTFHSGGHSSQIRTALRPVHHYALRHQLRHAGRLIGVSDYERNFFRSRLRLPSELFETIPNGVSEEFFRTARPTTMPSPRTMVALGRLEEYKGHDRVIRALPRVRRHHGDVRLQLIGRGSQQQALRALAARCGVGDVVEFTAVPYGERARLAELLEAAAVVVIMSSYESQCIAGLEAIAARARLVLANGSALTELRRYPGVRLVPQTGGEPLVRALVAQLDAPPLTDHVDIATWDDVTGRVEQTYRSVLAERASSTGAGLRCAS